MHSLCFNLYSLNRWGKSKSKTEYFMTTLSMNISYHIDEENMKVHQKVRNKVSIPLLPGSEYPEYRIRDRRKLQDWGKGRRRCKVELQEAVKGNKSCMHLDMELMN